MANPDRQKQLENFAEQLTITFTRWELLDQALTHASACNNNPNIHGHYENLEFLGDATLELVVSDLLFSRNPNGTPGLFTQMRAQIVNKKTLANVGRALNIAPFIQLGKGEERSGGRKRDALIADCVEALLAAIYVDMGWESVFQFVEQHFLEIIESVEASANQMDYRSQLQHYCQSQKMDLPEFRIVKEEGPDHDKMFEIEVHLGKEKCGLGRGTSKKAAEQEAARQALSIKGVAQS